MNVLILVGVCVVLGVIGQLMMKKGMNIVGSVLLRELLSKKFFSIIFNKYVFTGIVLYGLSCIFWLVALSMAEVSYIYPLIGTGYVLTAILAWFFFGEELTTARFLGTVLISVGAYLVIIRL